MNNDRNVSLGNWMVTMLIMIIPIVNIVMLFVWAFGGSTETSKSNWAKAQLIWTLIGIVLSTIIIVLFGAAFVAAAGAL